jgi:hypothetical protein
MFDPKTLHAMVPDKPSASQLAGMSPADEAAVCKVRLFGQLMLSELYEVQPPANLLYLLEMVERTALPSKIKPLRKGMANRSFDPRSKLNPGAQGAMTQVLNFLSAPLPSVSELRDRLAQPGALTDIIYTLTRSRLEALGLLPTSLEEWRKVVAQARTIFPVVND